MRSINDSGLDLIKSFEGFKSHPYQDGGGIWTIGYGHTRNVNANSSPVTEGQAEDLLRQDVMNAEALVEHMITIPLNDNQYAALVSLAYNVGGAPLTHTLGEKLNAGDYDGAAEEFLKWNHVKGLVSSGLTRRREAENKLFNE